MILAKNKIPPCSCHRERNCVIFTAKPCIFVQGRFSVPFVRHSILAYINLKNIKNRRNYAQKDKR